MNSMTGKSWADGRTDDAKESSFAQSSGPRSATFPNLRDAGSNWTLGGPDELASPSRPRLPPTPAFGSFGQRSFYRRQASDLENWDILQDAAISQDEEPSALRRGGKTLPASPRIARSQDTLRGFFEATSSRPTAPSRSGAEFNAIRFPLTARSGHQSSAVLAARPDDHSHEGSTSDRGYEPSLAAIVPGTNEPIQEEPEEMPEEQQGEGERDGLLAGDHQNRQKGLPDSQQSGSPSWRSSPVVVAVMRCSIAYLLASLFTFVTPLAHLLSTTSEIDAHGRVSKKPAYSAHMVATIVVYFHPAKSAGNMLLADRFCLILITFSTLICLLSLGTVELFDTISPGEGRSWDWVSEMGDWTVCGLWIGGSMGLLAWAKVWVGNPSFNSGCSMAAVTIYTVVIKEGKIPKLLEVLLIVFFGTLISNLVCFTMFPTTATNRLQKSISTSLKSFSTLLDLLAATFLLEKKVLRSDRTTLREAVQAHGKAFKTLKSDLAEAKHERILDERVRGKKLNLYDAAILSMGRLAQHISGLRSGTKLQEALLRGVKEGNIQLVDGEEKFAAGLTVSALGALPPTVGPPGTMDLQVDVAQSIELFKGFRKMAGEQMNQLVDGCEDALEAVEGLFTSSGNTGHTALGPLRTTLAEQIRTFTRSSSVAIKRLYAGPRRRKEIYQDSGDSSSSESEGDGPTAHHSPEGHSDGVDTPALDPVATTDGPNEAVFLIYFFLFTLEEFAREILFLLDTVSEIVQAEHVSAWDHVRSLVVRKTKQHRKDFLYQKLQQLVPVDPSKTQPSPFSRRNRQEPSDYEPTEAPQRLSVLDRFRHVVWKVGDWLKQPDKRYVIKVWVGGAILAAPAFTEWGRPTFMEFRGEWALIAYFATMSPTVGQTNELSVFRIGGTLLGAGIGTIVYSLFPENPIILPFVGFLFSIPCFYVITQMPDYLQAGRFTLLTYNLTCLYAYNKREQDYPVWQIALFRSTTVILGALWSAVVSRWWWPFTARRELRMGISDFCLDLSYLYSKLVTTYSLGVDPPEPMPQASEDENEPLLPVGSARHPHLNAGVRQFLSMELHLQGQLTYMRTLLSQTKREPRLKGPFPVDFYNEVLLSCERMLDRLHSMRCVTTRDAWDNGIRRAFVAPVNKQRREMAGSVILYFYILSAGFRLRTPMPPYLPPAEQGRLRLVEAIRNLDVVKRRSVRGGGRHLLFFAYALAMQEVIDELEFLGRMMQEAFGVISQTTAQEFEALFEATPRGVGDGETRSGAVPC